MEWVKKPQITCEADKTWNTTVRGGGRTGVTWYDKGQEHERPEDIKQRTHWVDIGERTYIYKSGVPAFLHALQKVENGPDSDQRLGDSLLGLHLKCRVAVRALGWEPAEKQLMEFDYLTGSVDWQRPHTWDRQSIFAAIVRDVSGAGETGQAAPEAIAFVSTLSDDGKRMIPRGLHSLNDRVGQWEIIAYDSWTPRKDPIRMHRKAEVNQGEQVGELYMTFMHSWYLWEKALWEDENHEFYFSIDLEQALHYGETNTPISDGLYLVVWGGALDHPGLTAIGDIREAQYQFTWEEILTNAQRKRAMRDRILNTQVERSVYGKQTHVEQQEEEQLAQLLENPVNPDVAEEYMEKIEEHRGQRRERDEGDEVEEERAHSFRRTGRAKDLEVLTGMSWNDEMESVGKKRK